MTLTPAQLDAIATKLLGWTPNDCGYPKYYTPMEADSGDGYTKSWREYHRRPNPSSRDDAMLVLEAMGRALPKRNEYVSLEHWYDGTWVCEVTSVSQSNGEREVEDHAEADTPAAAIFQCAAQLVERM